MKTITLFVKSEDITLKSHRELVAERVIDHFKKNLPVLINERAICYLDDEDSAWLRTEFGCANRGIHWPFRGRGLNCWPEYMWGTVANVDERSGKVSWPYDSIVYLHGSTCETDILLTLTLTHELQHFLQYAKNRSLWAVHTLLTNLPNLPRDELRAWKDFPLEKEARIVAKRVAESLFGADCVGKHICMMIKAHLTDQDAEDWSFVHGIDCSLSYDPVDETKRLVRMYKEELKQVQEGLKSPRDIDITTVDLDDWE